MGFRIVKCLDLSFDGSGVVEVAIILIPGEIVLSTPDQERTSGGLTLTVDEFAAGRVYREILANNPTRRRTLVYFDESAAQNLGIGARYRIVDGSELVVLMDRVGDRCTMSATVSGDASGYFFGDVAYFNDLTGAPVKEGMAAGSLADPESQEMMGEFIEGMGDMALRLREMGFETPGLDENASPGGGREEFAAFIEEELRAGDGEAGDNFGLSLADVKLDGNPDKSRAAAAALLGNAFTLNLSGSMRKASGQERDMRRVVEPSTLTATVGLGDEGDTIPFVLPPGSSPQILFLFPDEEHATGRVVARMVTERKYTLPGVASSRQLEIELNARFVARRGAFGCMR